MKPNLVRNITCLIIDDEPMARATIRLLLKGDPEIEVVGECGNGFEAVQAIEKQQPDLIFLDIQMPEMNGFEILNRLPRNILPFVVFVTAHDKYALQAFEVNAIDYLLKPFDDERFETALQRTKEQIKQRQVSDIGEKLISLLQSYEGAKGTAGQFIERLAIKTGGRISFIRVEEIDWIEAADQYIQLHVGKKTHLLRKSMNALEQSLPPDKFCRVHRSAIVNLERVEELRPTAAGDYELLLRDGTKLKLSRNRRESLQGKMGWGF